MRALCCVQTRSSICGTANSRAPTQWTRGARSSSCPRPGRGDSRPMLELQGVRKYYTSAGGEVRAVDDLNLTVNARELVAIFGPSGSGKTTLLLLAAGLLRADSGSVRFEGRDLAALSRSEEHTVELPSI